MSEKEKLEMNKTELNLFILKGLLNYHERMMLFRDCPADGCKNKECVDGKCPNIAFLDVYAEALREAIRCVEKDCTKRRYDHLTDGGPAYDVEITEVLKKTVSVNAYSIEVAELEVACRYKNGDYILDENDLESRRFTAVAKLSTPAE